MNYVAATTSCWSYSHSISSFLLINFSCSQKDQLQHFFMAKIKSFTVAMLEFGKMILHFQTQSLLTPLLNYMPVFRLFFFTIDLTCNCVLIVSKIRCISFKILTRFSTLGQLFKNNQRTRSYKICSEYAIALIILVLYLKLYQRDEMFATYSYT